LPQIFLTKYKTFEFFPDMPVFVRRLKKTDFSKMNKKKIISAAVIFFIFIAYSKAQTLNEKQKIEDYEYLYKKLSKQKNDKDILLLPIN